MEIKHLLLGTLTAAFIFGAYFIGFFQGQRCASKWREFFASTRRSLTWKGIIWSLALPAGWSLLYYAFVAHLRLAMGRWPNFGENLGSGPLALHYGAVLHLLGALVGSLYLAAIILVACLFFPRWRHVSVYALCYGGGVGVAFWVLFLAPRPFLNWLFD